MLKSESVSSPISFPVNVARLPQRGMPVKIVADEHQRRELADVHGLAEIKHLTADLMIAAWKRNGVRVSGKVEGEIVQTCVATLEPIENKVAEEIEAVFLPDDSKLGREGFGAGGEIILDAEGPDSPEIFSGDMIDVGALAEEFFALGIDPYPRKQGTGEENAEEGFAGEEKPSAFGDKLRDALSKR